MIDSKKLTRRDFTVSSVLALLSGVAITITGCGDSNDTPTTPTPTPTPTAMDTDVTGTVGTNHGHTAVITAAQLTSNATVMLDIMGTSIHSHTVEITVVDLGQIVAGTRVTKTSSTDDGHSHTVTFN
ncbi:MAG: hypothetical protein E2P02_30710 [Acidobacteria bacterium]|nr:MAG: hypothetical protein E2P02_30710 [Acidobacteriota bacterium]